MIPQAFEYDAPSTLDEAIALLQRHGEEAKILSGGHSLIPMMKLRFATPERLIDINNIPGLDYIRESGGYLRIGALTRESALEHSELLGRKYPIFGDVSKLIADPQVRNLGTLGGNLAHGDAANDHPAVMLALRAEIEATGPQGKRLIPIDEFFFGFYMTALQHGEILTEVRVPIPAPRSGGAYHKMERKVGDYATAGVAAQITLDQNDVCQYIGIGLTNVNPTPLRAERSEAELLGQKLTPERIARAAQQASEDCNPSADLRGDEDYKRHIVKVLVNRVLQKAAARAKA
jgi:carbon-monoxide dehydrogenase medium subunit